MLAGSKIILMLLGFAERIAKFQRVNFKSRGAFGGSFRYETRRKNLRLNFTAYDYRMKFHYAKPFAEAPCRS